MSKLDTHFLQQLQNNFNALTNIDQMHAIGLYFALFLRIYPSSWEYLHIKESCTILSQNQQAISTSNLDKTRIFFLSLNYHYFMQLLPSGEI